MNHKKIFLPNNVNPEPFTASILQHLQTKLSKQICILLSSLLAIDYALRLKYKLTIDEHAESCSKKLLSYLENKNVTDKSFFCIITLFIVAINKNEHTDDENPEYLSKAHDALINSVIIMKFSDIDAEIIPDVKKILRELIVSDKNKDMLNFIVENPELFYSIVKSIYQKQKKELSIMVLTQLNKLLLQKIKISSKLLTTKKIISKTSALEKYKKSIKSKQNRLAR